MKQLQKDRLCIQIYDNRNEMGQAAAREIRCKILDLLEQKPTINMIFAAAPSQNDVLAALIADPAVPWERIHGFHMDEYIGLAADHPAGFANFLCRSIFDLVPFKTVNCLNGQNPDPEQECVRYEELLLKYPADIIFMGIGENAHVAFCDPGAAFFDDPKNVKIVALAETCRNQQVNDGCFATIDEVPTHALTLTVPIMMRVPHMMLIAPTALKADAIHNVVCGPVDEMVPASVVRTHKGGATLFTDEAGASRI